MARRTPKSQKGKGRGAGTALLAFLVLLAAAAGAAWFIAVPFGPESETFVELPSGSTSTHLAGELESAGIIRSRYAFDFFRLVKRGRLKAGEYRFDHPAPVWEVYDRIARGDVYTRTVVIPEGASVFDIAVRLQKAGVKAGENFVEEQSQLTRLIADLDPHATSLEGYLFPDTYRFQRAATVEQVCTAMVKRFRTAANEIGLRSSVHRVVTIASLVERETAIDSERPLVASVFDNRLAKNMPLMTDPAVIYGLELGKQWRGSIYQSDLKRDTPYNTYLHAGLPPGPIANPGLHSLEAAKDPAQSNYLYFVAAGANPQGKSLFAATLAEHAHNVSGYRHAVKKAGGR